MTLRTQRRLLGFLAVLILGASGGIAALPWTTFAWPKPQVVVPSRPPAASRTATTPSGSAEPALTVQAFQAYWSRPLRRPLYDPPPPPPPAPVVVTPPPPRPIAARLLATMVEPGNSMAMLRLSTGEVVFRKLDDPIGAADADATISAIEDGVIRVKRDQQTSKLVVDGPKGP